MLPSYNSQTDKRSTLFSLSLFIFASHLPQSGASLSEQQPTRLPCFLPSIRHLHIVQFQIVRGQHLCRNVHVLDEARVSRRRLTVAYDYCNTVSVLVVKLGLFTAIHSQFHCLSFLCFSRFYAFCLPPA